MLMPMHFCKILMRRANFLDTCEERWRNSKRVEDQKRVYACSTCVYGARNNTYSIDFIINFKANVLEQLWNVLVYFIVSPIRPNLYTHTQTRIQMNIILMYVRCVCVLWNSSKVKCEINILYMPCKCIDYESSNTKIL